MGSAGGPAGGVARSGAWPGVGGVIRLRGLRPAPGVGGVISLRGSAPPSPAGPDAGGAMSLRGLGPSPAGPSGEGPLGLSRPALWHWEMEAMDSIIPLEGISAWEDVSPLPLVFS